MLESINTLTASAVPVATPPDVAATLAYLATASDRWEREDIARWGFWISRPHPGDDLAGFAARGIYDRPAIVWG